MQFIEKIMTKKKEQPNFIDIKINSHGEMVLSTTHNDRLIRRKYLYKTEEEATEHFKQFLCYTK